MQGLEWRKQHCGAWAGGGSIIGGIAKGKRFFSKDKSKWRVMGVEIIRPRVGDLVFQLYGRPLHPELFDIGAWRKVRREDYEVTLRITRTGHVITWENEDVLLTEVAAAADQELPEKRRLLSYRLRGEHSGTLSCAHGITYQTTFQVETLAPGPLPRSFTTSSWQTVKNAG